MEQKPINIPTGGQWTQPNQSDLLGSLFSTRNINLDVPGLIKLSKRSTYYSRSVIGAGDMGRINAIVYGNFGATTSSSSGTEAYHFITSNGTTGFIYKTENDASYFEQITNASTPTTITSKCDAISWNGGLWVATGNSTSKVCSLVAGTWTSGLTSVNASNNSLCQSSINNYLLIGNANVLHQRTTGGTDSTPVTLPAQFNIEWIRSSNRRTYIGTRTNDSSNARVFFWDESPGGASDSYEVDCQWILSGLFVDNDFYIFTCDGRLMIYNGGGFTQVACLPIYRFLKNSLVTDSQIYGTFSNTDYLTMAQRGMDLVDGKIHINLDGKIKIPTGTGTYRYYNCMPSGIWVYNGDETLYHKYGATIDTGDFDFLQQNYSSAVAPGAILGMRLGYVGDSMPASSSRSVLWFGASPTATTIASGFNSALTITTGTNRGQFETEKIPSSAIAGNAVKVWCVYYGLFTSADKILFKYKDQEKENYPLSIYNISTAPCTWTSTTTFTSTNSQFSQVEVGEMITILNGAGGGCSAHVSSITNNAGTYTVVLDEAIPGVVANYTFSCTVDNYKRVETEIDYTEENSYKDIVIKQNKPETFTQILVELRGESTVTIEDLKLIVQPQVFPTA